MRVRLYQSLPPSLPPSLPLPTCNAVRRRASTFFPHSEQWYLLSPANSSPLTYKSKESSRVSLFLMST